MINRLFILSVGVLLMIACEPKPEPLSYNKDACQSCKMTLVDKKFGAEIVTKKGKVFKFDDANCMINYMNENKMDDRDIAFRLITDYSRPATLIEADNAFYMKSEKIQSPMNSQVAAFEVYDTMNAYKKRFKGIYMSWGELVAQFK